MKAQAEMMSDGTMGETASTGTRRTALLTLGAIGVVFGDIGTSPLYALKESFVGHHPLTPDELHIFGVISIILWTMVLIVTIKYVLIMMRADNKGEGGSLSLLALISRNAGPRSVIRPSRGGANLRDLGGST